jgi:hypothetical protein
MIWMKTIEDVDSNFLLALWELTDLITTCMLVLNKAVSLGPPCQHLGWT